MLPTLWFALLLTGCARAVCPALDTTGAPATCALTASLDLTDACLVDLSTSSCADLDLNSFALTMGASVTAAGVTFPATLTTMRNGYLVLDPSMTATSVTCHVANFFMGGITTRCGTFSTLQSISFPDLLYTDQLLTHDRSNFLSSYYGYDYYDSLAAADETAFPALVTWNFPQVYSIGCLWMIQVVFPPTMPDFGLLFPALNTVANFGIVATSFRNVTLPLLTHANEFDFFSNRLLSVISVPAMTSVSETVYVLSNPALTTFTLPQIAGRQAATFVFKKNAALTTVSFPGVTAFDDQLSISESPLVNLVAPNLIEAKKLALTSGPNVNMVLNTLTAVGQLIIYIETPFQSISVPNLVGNANYTEKTIILAAGSTPHTPITFSLPAEFDSVTFESDVNVVSLTLLGTTVNDVAFQSASAFTSVSLPNLITARSLSFSSCANLDSILLPSLTSVANLSVQGNPSLRFIYAPALTTVTNLTVVQNPVLSRMCLTDLTTASTLTFGRNPSLSANASLAMLSGAGVSLSAICPSLGAVDCDFLATPPNATEMCMPPPPPAAPPPAAPIVTRPTDEGTLNGQPCPVGGICPGGGIVYPKAGYWNPGNDSGFVAECEEPASIRCAGGPGSPCGEGYAGTLCGGCQAGFYERGSECVACQDSGDQTVLYAVTGVIFGLFAIAHVVLDDAKLDFVVSLFKWLQLLRVAGTKTGYNLPTGVKDINDNLALVTFDYAFLKPACVPGVTNVDFSRLFWGNAVVLACLVVPPLLILTGLALFHKPRRAQWLDRIYRTVIVLVLLMYFVVATRAIQSVTCVKVGQLKVLKASTTEACTDNAVIGVGALALAIFIAGVPLATFGVLAWLHRAKRLQDPRTVARFGYSYHKLRLDKYRFGFGVVQLAHLLLVALAWNSFPVGISPYAFTVATYAFMLLLTIGWRPFETARKNALTVLSTGVGFVSTVANLMTLTTVEAGNATIPVVVVLFVLVIAVSAAVLVVEQRRARKDGKKDDRMSGSEASGKELSSVASEEKGSKSSVASSAASSVASSRSRSGSRSD